MKEDHAQPIFGVQFNQHLRDGQPLVFATAGNNRISIYQCMEDGSTKLLQCYSDPDVSAWSPCGRWAAYFQDMVFSGMCKCLDLLKRRIFVVDELEKAERKIFLLYYSQQFSWYLYF